MPDPPFGPIDPGSNIPPDMSTYDKSSTLDSVARFERKKMFGYNMLPDAGYEFKSIFNDGSRGKESVLSWYTGLGIKNLNISAVTAGELPFHSALNLYVPKEGFQTTVIDTEALSDPTDTTQQKPYIDSNFKLNLGESAAMKAANMLGTAFNGQGIGLEEDPAGGLTPVSSFDLRSSLAGRILGGTGAMEDTPIGLIGAQQLARALQNNILFNLQEETVGRINLNPLSLLTGNDIFTPNYEITVPKGAVGKILDFALRVTGFEIPISLLNKEASIYSSDRMIGEGNWFPEPNDELLRFTSLGQRNALKKNLNKNLYGPTYNKIDLFGNEYDRLSDVRIKEDPDGVGPLRNVNGKESYSVLDYNGLVRMSPLKMGDEIEKNPKAYMLSLENLAWADHLALLPEWEIGHGDKLTDKKGRMMWFPPYDLSYSEQVNVSWNEEQFIGRGEPIFTYNQTNRTIQLSFRIVVDHSSNMNLGSTQQHFTAFTKNIRDLLPKDKKAETAVKVEESKVVPPIVKAPEKIEDVGYEGEETMYVYFPQAATTINVEYEDGTAQDTPYTVDPNLKHQTTKSYVTKSDFGLNKDFFSKVTATIAEINKIPETIKIVIDGFASPAGNADDNKILGQNRAKAAKVYLSDNGLINKVTIEVKDSIGSTRVPLSEHDEKHAKEQRVAIINIIYTPAEVIDKIDSTDEKNKDLQSFDGDQKDKLKKEKDAKIEEKISQEAVNNMISTRYIDERHYFQYMEENDKFLFNSLTEKLKYFHPAFHSTTPEGLNSRLTFLHQCTRQGASIGDESDPRNLAFGRPPVCILRLGDFFYTKVIINSLNISYDTNQWDMNRDGIGLQPMIAKVDLNMHIIGGSSLQGPLSRLQNALSFNYYANTEMYDNRSDTIIKADDGKYKILNGFPSQYEDLTKENIEKQLKLREKQVGIDMANSKLIEDKIEAIDVVREPAPETIGSHYFVSYIYDPSLNERRFSVEYRKGDIADPCLKQAFPSDFDVEFNKIASGVCKKCKKKKIQKMANEKITQFVTDINKLWRTKIIALPNDDELISDDKISTVCRGK